MDIHDGVSLWARRTRAIVVRNRRTVLRGSVWPQAVVGVMWFELRAVVVTIIASAVILGFFPVVPPAVHAAEPKVVIIVGPVGSLTDAYRADGNKAAKAARAAGATVEKIYSPYATWPRARRALQGASLVVYLGHGNGWPSRYRKTPWPKTQNGLGLNPQAGVDDEAHQYFGEAYLARDVRLAPHAVVVLSHLCYASGNSEPGLPEGSLATGQKRVDNFAAGWLAAGADAVVAEGFGSPAYYVRRILAGTGTIESIWREGPNAHGHVLAFPSVRTPGMTALMDPTHKSSGFYRSLVGRIELRAKEVARGATGVKPGGGDVATPSPASAGPTITAANLEGVPTVGSPLRLELTLEKSSMRQAPGLGIGVRWDPISLDPPAVIPAARGGTASPPPDVSSTSPSPSNSSPSPSAGGPSASPSPSISSLSTSPSPGVSSPSPSAGGPSASPSPSISSLSTSPSPGVSSPSPSLSPSPRVTSPSASPPDPSASPDVSPPSPGATEGAGPPASVLPLDASPGTPSAAIGDLPAAPAIALISPEAPGAVVSLSDVRAVKSGIAAELVTPSASGLYRLAVTIHDSSGVAFDVKTQEHIPSFTVRVTGELSAVVSATDRLTLATGASVDLPVSVANTGHLAWVSDEPWQPDTSRRARPVPPWSYSALVAQWLVLGGSATISDTVAARVTIRPRPGTTEQVQLPLTAPPEPGPYLLLLDVVSPLYGSLTAVGGSPMVVRVEVTPPSSENPSTNGRRGRTEEATLRSLAGASGSGWAHSGP